MMIPYVKFQVKHIVKHIDVARNCYYYVATVA